MRAIIKIIADLQRPELNEEQLAKLLNEIEEHQMTVTTSFSVNTELWTAQLTTGNDLFYCGEGRTLPAAIADALNDWFQDYDCE